MTLTDQPRFGGSELRMSKSVDRVVALRVFESERGHGSSSEVQLFKPRTSKSKLFHFLLIGQRTVSNPINERT